MSEHEYEQTDAPRDVSIESSKHELYKELQQNESSPFENAQLIEIFMFAMAYGRKKKGKVALESGNRRALFNVSSLSEEQKWVVRSLAMKDAQTADVLQDKKQVYQIAMELANGGIDELHGKVFAPGDALSELSTEMISIADR